MCSTELIGMAEQYNTLKFLEFIEKSTVPSIVLNVRWLFMASVVRSTVTY